MSNGRFGERTVGLVVAPGVTERLAESLMEELPDMLSEQYNNEKNGHLIWLQIH